MEILVSFVCGFLVGGLQVEYVDYILQGKKSVPGRMIRAFDGFLYVLVVSARGWSWETALLSICASILMVISVIDQAVFEIPAGCNAAIGILGGLRLFLGQANPKGYLAGFFVVSAPLFIIYWITGGKGIGGGDVKLMAAAGLFLGWRNALLALFVGSLSGVVIHLVFIIRKALRCCTFCGWRGESSYFAADP